jgi:hypothetical protein
MGTSRPRAAKLAAISDAIPSAEAILVAAASREPVIELGASEKQSGAVATWFQSPLMYERVDPLRPAVQMLRRLANPDPGLDGRVGLAFLDDFGRPPGDRLNELDRKLKSN